MRRYWVYILASASRHLYIGVTNNLELRMAQHRLEVGGYTTRHRITQLVYYEVASDVRAAIDREKALKGWSRQRKLRLVESMNPTWKDLLPPG